MLKKTVFISFQVFSGKISSEMDHFRASRNQDFLRHRPWWSQGLGSADNLCIPKPGHCLNYLSCSFRGSENVVKTFLQALSDLKSIAAPCLMLGCFQIPYFCCLFLFFLLKAATTPLLLQIKLKIQKAGFAETEC